MQELQWFLFLWAFVLQFLSTKSEHNISKPSGCIGVICDGMICIPHSEICNGINNCDDGTDEKDCLPMSITCDSDRFLCTSDECIPWTLVCDGREDCEDASDESHDTCRGEGSGEGSGDEACMDSFPCSRGGCIPIMKRCDGHTDCIDGDDELDCNDIEDYTIGFIDKEDSLASNIEAISLKKLAILMILSRLVHL